MSETLARPILLKSAGKIVYEIQIFFKISKGLNIFFKLKKSPLSQGERLIFKAPNNFINSLYIEFKLLMIK
jgi:hypothetical protein